MTRHRTNQGKQHRSSIHPRVWCILGIALAALGLAAAAHAQQYALPREAAQKDLDLAPLDCSVLSGTPYVCVRNARHTSITGLSCSGMFGTTALSVPGGSIPAAATAVVNFRLGKCAKTINVTGRDGRSFTINGFDTDKNTILTIGEN